MIKLYEGGAYLIGGKKLVKDGPEAAAEIERSAGRAVSRAEAAKNTMAYGILKAHNTSDDMENLKLKFDAMASHDITYVGIVQTARASGLERFPIPYVLTNCHNSLCAVGGTINEDDHMFGLSAAKKYGGIFVPPHLAVIHTYMREMQSGCGRMILASDSHTRYGALGTMGVGEGGGELVKQLLEKTYDVKRPGVVAVYLTGTPHPGVGPQDVALAIIGAVFRNGYVKNKVMEFVGDGIENLPVEYRNGIDVMTTETTCLSSIWRTDGKVKEYFEIHGRPEAYRELNPGEVAYYDGAVVVDLAAVKPMIAMPLHPSNVYTIEELNANLADIVDAVEKAAAKQMNLKNLDLGLRERIADGRLMASQGFIGGCAGGTYDNVADVADILEGHQLGSGEFSLSIYPSSQPAYLGLIENGAIPKLMTAGAIVKTAFCGPCFGAGDVPAHHGFSIRHSTRNFPNREGSKPSDGQIASVALMDARSIGATALNGGRITPATDLDVNYTKPKYFFNKAVYDSRCYNGFGKADPEAELKFGPNITDWPQMSPLTNDLLLKVVSYITDDVTTTDELIPSGETSSYRSNPLRLAEFTLSRKDPGYVGRAKAVQKYEKARLAGEDFLDGELSAAYQAVKALGFDSRPEATGVGSVVYAVKPGDGSAREQAASCQKVLGGWANIAREYATKRYRSNLINWGMIPFTYQGEPGFQLDDFIFLPGIRKAIAEGDSTLTAYVLGKGTFEIGLPELTEDERQIVLDGCLINYYRGQ
ncbi:hydratase [Gehongia tenuis]|uniref:Hydratase n=1 Tax=Gehongia tenuis TaxID=2763655 RepID=A0A926D2Z2_9FIRM|nr:hydratase [Gehongia tenuis]MBC8530276.1 hydratase [Gehongia tenuis]